MSEQLAPRTYSPQELVELRAVYLLEHPDMPSGMVEDMFPEWLSLRELDLEPDSPVVVTEGMVRYLEGGDEV